MNGYGYEPRIRTIVAVKITGYADTNPLRSTGSYPLRLGDGSLSSHPQTTGYADSSYPWYAGCLETPQIMEERKCNSPARIVVGFKCSVLATKSALPLNSPGSRQPYGRSSIAGVGSASGP